MKSYPDYVISDFWSQVQRDPVGCWLWIGSCNRAGYGTYHRYRFRVKMLAHRLAWELANGEAVPSELFVLHHCDNPPCVRPDHLFLGTHLDNMADMRTKGRANSGEKNLYYRQAHQRTPNPPPPPYWKCMPTGEKHQNAKLTNREAEELRALYFKNGWTQVRLAKRFGISQSEVSYIVRGIHFITTR